MFGINLDTADLQYLENEVDRLNKFGIPNASRDTLTSAAYQTRDNSRDGLGKSNGPNFTIRNSFTGRSIMADGAKGSRISEMKSYVGSVQGYMESQEEGFTKTSAGSFGIAIPTRGAAGQDGRGIRTKVVRPFNRLPRISPVKAWGFNFPVKKGGNRNAAVWIAMQMAIDNGSRVIFIDRRRDHFHRKTGFYRVIGGTRRNPEGAKLKLLYSTSKKSVRVKPHEWLGPQSDATRGSLGGIYRKSLIKWIGRGRRR